MTNRCSSFSAVLLVVFAAGSLQAAESKSPTTPEKGATHSSPIDLPDPSTGGTRFNGLTWEISNAALFEARFEKFLSTPEETSDSENGHRKILNEIIARLDPSAAKPPALSEAYRLLTRATRFPGDSRHCDTLSGAIYAIWQSRRNQDNLNEINRILMEERSAAAKNMAAEAQSPTASKSVVQAGRAEVIAGADVRIKANHLKNELSELQAKIQFQSLIVQLFLQRRFHHVIIGTRFYRALFDDGDSKLNLPNAAPNPLGRGPGVPSTISTIDALANESIRDAQTRVQAFHKLYDLGELRAASERLREALITGEFMPEVRTLPFDRKRRILQFVQTAAKLGAALERRDYSTASQLLDGPAGIRETAKDFDDTAARQAIEGARKTSRLVLLKARHSASAGDKDAFEAALKEAAGIWPTNPELQEVTSTTFQKSDILAQTRIELDQLLAQKNFRRVAEESTRFLAAIQDSPPEKQEQLRGILQAIKTVEAYLARAEQMDRQGNPAGAWEVLDSVSQQNPADIPLGQARAQYLSKATDFVQALQTAREHERLGREASGLAWYLKAQRLYPKSELAEEAVRRLLPRLLPQKTD